MKNKVLTICNEKIQPGEKATLALQMPETYSCTPTYMPIKIIHGKDEGPCLFIFSTLNGNEMNGLEIVNRLIETLNPDMLQGTVIAVPVVNVYGLTHYPKQIPSGQEITACFPGDPNGNYGSRIAHIITQELLIKADFCIEIDTGSLNHAILPQVYCNFENQKTKELAKSFQVPVITNVSLNNNKLRQTTENLNIPLIVYQAGEAMRFDEDAIYTGVEGTKNFMRSVKMLNEEPTTDIKPVYSQDTEWIRAEKGGILHFFVSLGQTITKGETIGVISDPFSADVAEPVIAPQDGIIVGANTTPLIHEGLSIYKIASFLDYNKAETAIENWEEAQI